MKKKILSVFLISLLLLPSCTEENESKKEQSGEMSFVSENFESPSENEENSNNEENVDNSENAESVESTEEVGSAENSGSSENFESIDSSGSIESIEDVISDEGTESTKSSESVESFESTEEFESTENFESTESFENVDKSEGSETESSTSDSSYEIMDTPVIQVPEKLVAAEEDTFFDDSVLVGNSVMLGYKNFTNKQRAGSIPDFLGKAKFFCAGSWGVYHNNRTLASSSKATNPEYAGEKYSVEDVVGVMGVKTVYINFMGLNDLALYYDSKNCARKCADDVIKLIKKINDRYPDVDVVILSATYLTASRNNYASLNNKNLSMLNNYLLDYCNENGLDFVDIASQLTEKGCLADKYASDGYCHIGTGGYKIWTAILRDYAVRKMNNTYKNPERMPLLGINK